MSATSTIFSDQHLAELRTTFADLKKIDPCGPAYQKLTKLLDAVSREQMQQLAQANINFVSLLAKSRLLRWGK